MSAQPLRFCMVTTFYPPHHFGGDAVYVERLSSELARRGHSVTVVYAPDAHRVLGGRAAGSDGVGATRLEPLRGRMGPVAPLVTYLSGRPGFRARQLDELFAREHFDVVHFHNVSLVGGPGVLSYGRGVKLYTTHEHWLVCPMHTLWKHNREVCDRPTCLRCTLAFRRPPQLWRYGSLLERSAAHVDLFLAPSTFTRRMHAERGFRFPMRTLPGFVPSSEAARVEPNVRSRPYFLAVGRLERIKGFDTLVDAFRGFDAADLLIAGEGEQGDELGRVSAGLRHVELLGRRPRNELQSLYAGAVAVLQPSVGYETFGLTVIEGFAQGTPAVVRDLGPLPELIEESGAGYTFRTNDELVGHARRLLEDRALRDELGAQGRRAYEERWSEEPHLHGYFEAIEDARRRSRERILVRKGPSV